MKGQRGEGRRGWRWKVEEVLGGAGDGNVKWKCWEGREGEERK